MAVILPLAHHPISLLASPSCVTHASANVG
jgi:hypothetical protein